MRHTSLLIITLLIACVAFVVSYFDHNLQRGEIDRRHSFQSPYLFGVSSSIPYWEYGGSAVATENFVRLVPAVKSRVGWIWNLQPVFMKDWEVIIEFSIHNSHSPGADGLAFWYARDMRHTGPLYGYSEDFDGLGIIFDTYDNNGDGESPSVICIKNNGYQVKWDYSQDLKPNQIASCSSPFRNSINGKVRARITYEHGVLSVAMDNMANGEFTPCFSVSLHLNAGMHFGLTAATGGLADFHDVYSFVASDLNPTATARISEEAPQVDRKHLHHHQHNTPSEQKSTNQANQVENDESKNNMESSKIEETVVDKRKPRKEKKQKDVPILSDPKEHEFFEKLRDRLRIFGMKTGKKDDLTDSSSRSDSNDALTQRTGLLILEALEEVSNVVQSTSTKGDIDDIMQRVEAVSNKQEIVEDRVNRLGNQVESKIENVVAELKGETARLAIEIKKLERVLHGLGGSIDQITEHQGRFQDVLRESHQKITDTVQQSQSYGFFTYFIFAMIIIGAFIGFRVYKNNQRRHMSRIYA